MNPLDSLQNDPAAKWLPQYAPVRDELRRVIDRLTRGLQCDDRRIAPLVQYGVMLGGKRLRPALLLLTARALGEIREEHITLGIVVELIHTASLIHDDVLDEADLRRHLKTVNIRWGTESSVLLGDYLFTHALWLATAIDDPRANRVLAETTRTLCEGELRQVSRRNDFELTLDDYYSIIQAKTARLYACCCLLGAYYAGAEEPVVVRMEAFGHNLGIAFQIADDLLDLLGEQNEVGKSLGTDLEKGKLTLPLILWLEQLDDVARGDWIARLQNPRPEDRRALVAELHRSGVVEQTRQTARQYCDRARAELSCLPASPARDSLEQLSRFVLDRSH